MTQRLRNMLRDDPDRPWLNTRMERLWMWWPYGWSPSLSRRPTFREAWTGRTRAHAFGATWHGTCKGDAHGNETRNPTPDHDRCRPRPRGVRPDPPRAPRSDQLPRPDARGRDGPRLHRAAGVPRPAGGRVSGSRLVICGVPKAGKTTYAAGDACFFGLGRVHHTDDLIDPSRGWSDVSAVVATWLDAPGPYIIEGVAAVRALRKWLRAHPDGKPCDRVLWLGLAKIPLTPGQLTMAKGCNTVWNEIRAELVARGVQVEEQ